MTKKTMGERLLELKDRSGLSLQNIAHAAEFRSASSVQRYFSPEYEAEHISAKLAERLKEAFVGYGDPPITEDEVERLTEYGFMLDRRLPAPMRANISRREDAYIECNWTARYADVEGIEAFAIGEDPIRFFRKAASLNHRRIAAIVLSTASMMPKYAPGDIVFYELEHPPMFGQDAVFTLRQGGEEAPMHFLAKLIGQDRESYQIEFYEPREVRTVDIVEIDSVAPVLPAAQLLDELTKAEAYARNT